MRADEFYGLPEYWIETTITEDAGSGIIRVYNYAKKGGKLVPLFTSVRTAENMLLTTRQVESATIEAWNKSQMKLGVGH